MPRRTNRNKHQQYRYCVCVFDWFVDIDFNEYAYINPFDVDQFEERIKMIMLGKLISTDSKKCAKDMSAKVIIHPSDIWYRKNELRKDLSAIGDMEIIKAKSGIEKVDTLYFRISVPTKSYENMKDYIVYKGKALVTVVGTDLFRRKGNIYYLGFTEYTEQL